MSDFQTAIDRIKARLAAYFGRNGDQLPKPVAETSAKPAVLNQSPKISVIIPIYGTEAYVEKCVRSVMDQTLREIEILCIDDCSPDNSAAIIERLAAEDGRIRLIRHERNLGLGGARNTGIEAARAPYVAGVDSDDYIQPEMMERLWTGTEGQTADVVACNMMLISATGELLNTISFQPGRLQNDHDQLNIFGTYNPSFCNKLWRRSLFIDNDIRFPEHCYYEDLATSPRLLRHAKELRTIPDNLYRYVYRETSITRTTSAKHITDYFKVYDLLQTFLEAEGLRERYRVEFRNIFNAGLAYHASNVTSSALDEAEKRQYLRTMLMLKLSYLEYRDPLHDLDAQMLQELIAKAVSRQDLEP